MPRGHKYIKKYRNSHGNWTYVYKRGIPNGTEKPTVHTPDYASFDVANGAARVHVFSNRQTFVTRNKDTSQRYAYAQTGPNSYHSWPIASKGVHRRDKTSNMKANPDHVVTNKQWTSKREQIARNAARIAADISVNNALRSRKLTKIEKGKAKITSIIKKAKRTSSNVINRGKQTVRRFIND